MIIGVIQGFRVILHPEALDVARAVGLLWRRRIIVNQAFVRLPHRVQVAILLHEVKHCVDHHLAKRVLLVPVFLTRYAARIVKEQELAADAHAALHGFGGEMISFIRRYTECGEFYPTVEERCTHIAKTMRESIHVEKAA